MQQLAKRLYRTGIKGLAALAGPVFFIPTGQAARRRGVRAIDSPWSRLSAVPDFGGTAPGGSPKREEKAKLVPMRRAGRLLKQLSI